MKKLLSILAVLSMVLSLCGPVGAKGAAKKGKSLEGTLTYATRAKVIVDVGDGSEGKTVIVVRTTTVTGGGKPLTLDDLAVGQKVSIALSGNVAKSVDILK